MDAANNQFLVKTRSKTVGEARQFYKWLDENFISYSYNGQLTYVIEGLGDATLVKLFWGEDETR